MKPMTVDEAIAHTGQRLKEVLKKGAVPKDVLALQVLALAAYDAANAEARLDALRKIVLERGHISFADWQQIFWEHQSNPQGVTVEQ